MQPGPGASVKVAKGNQDDQNLTFLFPSLLYSQ